TNIGIVLLVNKMDFETNQQKEKRILVHIKSQENEGNQEPSKIFLPRKKVSGSRRRKEIEDISSEAEEIEGISSSKEIRKKEKGIPVHISKNEPMTTRAEEASKFIIHQETEEDRWKLKSGGGLIFRQFTTTQGNVATTSTSNQR